MPRPKFAPGSTAVFVTKNRSGKKNLAGYLASRLGVVDDWARDLIAGGRVDVDGQTAVPGGTINLSDGAHEIVVRFPDAWPRHMAATEMPLDILHEDEFLLVLNKPAGIVVHPARGHLDNQTLQNGVRHRYRHLLGKDGVTLGSPHRLDRDTSGVIVFAIETRTYIDLVGQFSASTPHKTYVALLDGSPDFARKTVDAPLGRDPERKGCGTVLSVEAGGKTARTDFEILESGRASGKGWALARATPFTGRAHQIRIHAASLGLCRRSSRARPSTPPPSPSPTPPRGNGSRWRLRCRRISQTLWNVCELHDNINNRSTQRTQRTAHREHRELQTTLFFIV